MQTAFTLPMQSFRLSRDLFWLRRPTRGRPALSTPLLAASRSPNAFNFGRALRRGSRVAGLRFALRLGLRVADRLWLRVTDRLGLRIADRLGQHLMQLSLRLRPYFFAHRSSPVTGETRR
jgi:hypothetical protein